MSPNPRGSNNAIRRVLEICRQIHAAEQEQERLDSELTRLYGKLGKILGREPEDEPESHHSHPTADEVRKGIEEMAQRGEIP